MKLSRPPSILVVEDDPSLNKLLCLFLKNTYPSTVVGYFSGEEMISELDNYNNPIIVQDYDLPGMNGLEVIKYVKSRYRKIEFIFLSGQNVIEVALEAMRAGAFDYIVKDNFAKENVLTKIKYLSRIRALIQAERINRILTALFLGISLLTWMFFLLRYFITKA